MTSLFVDQMLSPPSAKPQQRKHPEQALIFALGAFVTGEHSPASILALASIHVLQMSDAEFDGETFTWNVASGAEVNIALNSADYDIAQECLTL
ncbi:hypothetical protein C8J55DRAFT_558647 [Lentinula edodes]|uniref:Uncharacterized protein n=1 Tax=Lentinula lateritia TaxID=40482 RepID=A0A9W9API7_9AGAR|nr:hypothetical protein C8J55DRAFT_558647 [Lentinula edodes]